MSGFLFRLGKISIYPTFYLERKKVFTLKGLIG